MKQFKFYIIGIDIDKYADILIEQNGEQSCVVQLLDANYYELEKKHEIFADKLLEMRNFLADHGYEEQVKKCDEEFVNRIGNRGAKCPHISMLERWKKDDESRIKK